MDPHHSAFFRPNRIDNKSFPADRITSGIAGECATNCTHCGECERILKQVLKYDVDHDLRASTLSFTHNTFLLAPKRKVSERIKINPGFQ